jgi:hypothetical protein
LTSSDAAVQFGDSDAVARWGGLERHRVALVAVSLALGADAALRPGTRWAEWAGAVVGVVLSVSGPSRQSWAQYLGVLARGRLRRRVTWVEVTDERDSLLIARGVPRRVWCYDFVHHGRLDLAGRDRALAQRLGRMAESLADTGVGGHLAVHVESRDDLGPRTVLSVTTHAVPPSEWTPDPRAGVPVFLGTGRTVVVERRHYLRTPDTLVRTLRVSSFSPGREGAALEALSVHSDWLTIALHASVVPTPRARRLTSRAVHRVTSDAQIVRGAGFRWSARREWELEALRRREHWVATGAALCRWALYVVVRAETLAQLRERVDALVEVASSSGLRLDPGTGRQAEWFGYQLPGGVGW